MDQNAIFLPALALMGWTFLVLLMIPFRRFKAAFSGEVCGEDFLCGESDNVPPAVRLPNRMFMNLLEMPTVFYTLSIILFLTRTVDSLCLMLAWIYVGLRVLHTLITLTYNNVFHRFLAFAFSNMIVLGLWLKLVGALLK